MSPTVSVVIPTHNRAQMVCDCVASVLATNYSALEKPHRAFCFARNRLRFAHRHFPLPQILSVTLVFAPLSAAYYGLVALKNRRPDIAWAYLKGTLAGMVGL